MQCWLNKRKVPLLVFLFCTSLFGSELNVLCIEFLLLSLKLIKSVELFEIYSFFFCSAQTQTKSFDGLQLKEETFSAANKHGTSQ